MRRLSAESSKSLFECFWCSGLRVNEWSHSNHSNAKLWEVSQDDSLRVVVPVVEAHIFCLYCNLDRDESQSRDMLDNLLCWQSWSLQSYSHAYINWAISGGNLLPEEVFVPQKLQWYQSSLMHEHSNRTNRSVHLILTLPYPISLQCSAIRAKTHSIHPAVLNNRATVSKNLQTRLIRETFLRFGFDLTLNLFCLPQNYSFSR